MNKITTSDYVSLKPDINADKGIYTFDFVFLFLT